MWNLLTEAIPYIIRGDFGHTSCQLYNACNVNLILPSVTLVQEYFGLLWDKSHRLSCSQSVLGINLVLSSIKMFVGQLVADANHAMWVALDFSLPIW